LNSIVLSITIRKTETSLIKLQVLKDERDDRDGAPRENNNGGATRYFVNIGSRDNFDWMSLKDYLKETLDLGRDDVFKVV
jgi:hypothetical protein